MEPREFDPVFLYCGCTVSLNKEGKQLYFVLKQIFIVSQSLFLFLYSQ